MIFKYKTKNIDYHNEKMKAFIKCSKNFNLLRRFIFLIKSIAYAIIEEEDIGFNVRVNKVSSP